MKQISYKIVPYFIPAIKVFNKKQDHLKNNKHKEPNKSRPIESECIACEFISDGENTIKLSELIKKLKEWKEIKLEPLTLCYNENVTEYHVAKQNEGFSSVTVHVCVDDQPDIMLPYRLICYTRNNKYDFRIKEKHEIYTEEDLGDFVCVLLYSKGNNKNIIEIKIDDINLTELEDNCFLSIIPKNIFGMVTQIIITGLQNENEYIIYDLESDNLQQNQKITVLNYL